MVLLFYHAALSNFVDCVFAYLQIIKRLHRKIAILPENRTDANIADKMKPSRRREAAEIAVLYPFTQQTALTGYYPVPREVLKLNLPTTAILLYAVLLDRATLSKKSGWMDEAGRVYVIYPIEKLALTIHVSETAVKRHLAELERDGLIERQRPVGNGPSHIFVNIPEESRSTAEGQQNAPSEGAKTPVRQVRTEPQTTEESKKKYLTLIINTRRTKVCDGRRKEEFSAHEHGLLQERSSLW